MSPPIGRCRRFCMQVHACLSFSCSIEGEQAGRHGIRHIWYVAWWHGEAARCASFLREIELQSDIDMGRMRKRIFMEEELPTPPPPPHLHPPTPCLPAKGPPVPSSKSFLLRLSPSLPLQIRNKKEWRNNPCIIMSIMYIMGILILYNPVYYCMFQVILYEM